MSFSYAIHKRSNIKYIKRIMKLSLFHRFCRLIATTRGKRLPLPTVKWLFFLREDSPMISSFITLWISHLTSSQSWGQAFCHCPEGSWWSFPWQVQCKGKEVPSLRLRPATCFVWFSCNRRHWKVRQLLPRVNMVFWLQWTWLPSA